MTEAQVELGPKKQRTRTLILHSRNFARLVSGIVFLTIWQAIGMATNPLFLPTPLEVVAAIPVVYTKGELLANLLSSFGILGAGFMLSLVLGITLGIVIGRYEFASNFSDLYINVFYAMPVVALIPLFMIWFGIGDTAKIMIVFLSGFFPILMNAEAGVRSVDYTLIEVARSLGAKESEIVSKIVLPGAVPFIMTGIRVAIGRAIVGLIVAELFLALSGLGALLAYYGAYYQTANYFVPLLILAAISVTMTEAARLVEKKFTSWKVEPLNR